MRRGGGGRRDRSSFVAEVSTMLVISLVLSVLGPGFFCWLLFTLAAYAFPSFAGLTAGPVAFHSGALLVGVLASGATLAIGQIAFATVRIPLIPTLIGLLYAVPTAFAGYQASRGLAEIGVPSENWREAFAITGVVLVGATALARMTLFVTPPTGQPIVEGPAYQSLADATKDG
jgi:hypothetical protein